ncbi:hypothetical protein MWU77_20220 [Rhodococcus sp. F64268]|uniref:plasmid mobilization protein n=1 Tax=Rhodococcus sp. F64268 TaxID=2926402 RepID=UPI001FF3F268|nr:hypothetical protein [Rhodococcus sp. F64268]MCK0093107.1 hypothetical protein [Rhodococcus sp. F64268]
MDIDDADLSRSHHDKHKLPDEHVREALSDPERIVDDPGASHSVTHKNPSPETQALIDRVAAEAEAQGDDFEINKRATTTRGNPRAKVLQVRLNPEEYDAIVSLADAAGLPTSTFVRARLLDLLSDRPERQAALMESVAAALAAVPAETLDALAAVRHMIGDTSRTAV